jgi:hypothetical protein
MHDFVLVKVTWSTLIVKSWSKLLELTQPKITLAVEKGYNL